MGQRGDPTWGTLFTAFICISIPLSRLTDLDPIGSWNLCLLVHSLILYEGNKGFLECVDVQKKHLQKKKTIL